MDLKTRRKRLRYRLKYMTDMPRLSVHKSNNYVYAQLINQRTGEVIASYDTKRLVKDDPSVADAHGLKKVELLGLRLGEMIKEKGIKKIVFDRSGYKYHGKVKILAESLRKSGLIF